MGWESVVGQPRENVPCPAHRRLLGGWGLEQVFADNSEGLEVLGAGRIHLQPSVGTELQRAMGSMSQAGLVPTLHLQERDTLGHRCSFQEDQV